MNNFQIQEQEEDFHIERASKWTVYFLVDLRIVFIISYVYISVLYLISTTANSEANADINSMKLFNVTSQPNHTNVIVTYIDDALLWSCRNLSVTKDYYKGLYSMLFAAFAVTMIFLTITKLTIFFGNRASISYLWKIAVVQYLQKPTIQHLRSIYRDAIKRDLDGNPDVRSRNGRDPDHDDDPDVRLAEESLNLIKTYKSKRSFTDKVCNKCSTNDKHSTNKESVCTKCTVKQKAVSKVKFFDRIRMANLLISVILKLIIVPLAFMSYDLHALSCIVETTDEFINYDPLTNTVELRYSDNMKLFRYIILFGILLPSLLVFLINAVCFYLCNSIIINNMKPLVSAYFNQIHSPSHS